MRFLILTQYFPPEIGGPQTRLKAVADQLIHAGHEVEVVTALPNYPRGRFFRGYERSFFRRETCGDILVRRVWLFPAMGGGVRRMMNYASFTLTSFAALLIAKKADYIFVESPPLILTIPAFLIRRLRRTPMVLNVSDLWPDAIIEGGFLQKGFLTRLLFTIERWSYRKAAYVSCVTEGIRSALIHDKCVPAEKILFLPNGVDTDLFRPSPADESLKSQLGLVGKKIVLWAGTLGYSHGLEYVLDAAKLLEKNPDIHFLFVGDGSAKAELIRRSRELRLDNVTFHKPVALETLPSYFSIAELGLASLLAMPLHDGARPSKIFPVMASGKPVVFVGSGETAEMVASAGAGIVASPGDAQALADAILQIVREPGLAAEFGNNARKYAHANFRWSVLVAQWLDRLAELEAHSISEIVAESGGTPAQAARN